jgi:hypothetical protein
MNLLIKITPEVLERAKMCGTDEAKSYLTNCAIAVAIRDVFPNAKTTSFEIQDREIGLCIKHSKEVLAFIDLFDNTEPDDRPFLTPLSFTVELPDEVVERIDISDIEKSETLELA